jgi:excisionase family DNA binding protein
MSKRNGKLATPQVVPPSLPVPEKISLTQCALTYEQAAACCGVKTCAIEEVVRDGRLKGRRLGRNVIILKSDLDDFLASLDVIPAHTPPSILKRREERARGTA